VLSGPGKATLTCDEFIEGHFDEVPGDAAEPEAAPAKVEKPPAPAVVAPLDAGEQVGAWLDTAGSTRWTRGMQRRSAASSGVLSTQGQRRVSSPSRKHSRCRREHIRQLPKVLTAEIFRLLTRGAATDDGVVTQEWLRKLLFVLEGDIVWKPSVCRAGLRALRRRHEGSTCLR
jgi:hypothetical protein